MSNLTTLQILLSKFPKLSKNASPSFLQWWNIQWISTLLWRQTTHQSSYQQKLNYNPVNTKSHSKRNHKRNIIWFKPPFNRNASTKVVKYFLNLLDQHFPWNHRLHKILDRNNAKVSYSYTKNMKTITNNHNKNILGKKPSIDTSNCNCRNQKNCPLNDQCQIGEVVYESTLTSNQLNCKDKKYFGIAEKPFKGRLYNHNLYFRNEFYKNFLRNPIRNQDEELHPEINLENYQETPTM